MVEGIGNKPIQGGFGNTQGIDGGTNVGGTKETKETKGVGLHGQLQMETLGKKAGITTSTTPQLTPPTGNYNAAGVANSILNTLGSLATEEPGKGLFVLYQLLVLLQKALNEMQQSTQLMRQAETNIAIANIQAEADTMESAASFALWMGVISGIVQIGSSLYGMASGFKGVANTAKAKATGEQLKTAQTNLGTLKTELGTLKTEMGTLNTEMGTLKTEMGTLKTELTTLQAADPPNVGEIAAKQQQITAKQEQITAKQAEIDTKQADIDTKQDAILAKQMEMTGLKTKMDMQLSTAQSLSNRGQAVSQLIGAGAGFIKTIGDGIASGKQADAKAIEGQIKMMEENASKTADLTKAVKDMLNAVLQLMQTVNRNEVDTTAQILRGI